MNRAGLVKVAEQLRDEVVELKYKLDDADMREQKLRADFKHVAGRIREADDEITELKFRIKAARLMLREGEMV